MIIISMLVAFVIWAIGAFGLWVVFPLIQGLGVVLTIAAGIVILTPILWAAKRILIS